MGSKMPLDPKNRGSHACPYPSIRTRDAFVDWASSFVSAHHACSVLTLSRSSYEQARSLFESMPDFSIGLLQTSAFYGPEALELGAVIEDGEIYLSRGSTHIGMSETEVEEAALEAIRELQDLRGSQSLALKPDFEVRAALLFDDGKSALVSLLAAIRILKGHHIENITIALNADHADVLRHITDPSIHFILFTPAVTAIDAFAPRNELRIAISGLELRGELLNSVSESKGLIVCAGDGRVRRAADHFASTGFTVLRANLYSEKEQLNSHTEYLTPLLAHRLGMVIEWICFQHDLRKLPLGIFGSDFASSAALQVSAAYPLKVATTVVRSMRTEVPRAYLDHIRAPTLFFDRSAHDEKTLRSAFCFELLNCEKEKVEIDENNETYVIQAADWFSRHIHALSRANSVTQNVENSGAEIGAGSGVELGSEIKRPPSLTSEASA